MADKKKRSLHCSGVTVECESDHLDVGRVKVDNSLLQRQTKKEDLLLSGCEHSELLQQRHEIGGVDKHMILKQATHNISRLPQKSTPVIPQWRTLYVKNLLPRKIAEQEAKAG